MPKVVLFEKGISVKRSNYLNNENLLKSYVTTQDARTAWKFKNFSPTQIFREINFGKFQFGKIAIFGNFRGPEFLFWGICAIFKAQIY